MKYIKLLFLSLSFAATFTACDMTDFGDINKDPNEPSEANTGMLFTYLSLIHISEPTRP